MKVSQH